MSIEPQAHSLAQPSGKRSGVEVTKETSNFLRGTIALTLLSNADHLGDGDKNLIKFHGSYQQEDRDARKNRSKAGVGKHYMFMVRCKIPGGKLTAEQYLALDDLAGQYANATLRITSRQGIQLHGILKDSLKPTIAGINHCLLTTLGACGDVNRNVMAPPRPAPKDSVVGQLQTHADAIAAHLAPRSHGYHEIWLNGQNVTPEAGPDDEPIYGKVYLPRKFKIGFALPEDNSVDVYAQDLGFLGLVEEGKLVGYNVLVGGGMGMTHGNAATFPHMGQPICSIAPDQAVAAAEAVVKLFRDHGNRADRKRARIKYVVHDWGVARFREVLQTYLPFPLVLPKPVEVTGYDLALGWRPQGNGQWFYGLSIENGRIKDEGTMRLRSGLRAIMERFQPEVRLTPMQDILLCGLKPEHRGELERMLDFNGIIRPEKVSPVQRYSMACPAIPTCGLAISESERALPDIVDELEAALAQLGLAEEKIGVRMTGCPNGCVRPYQSDIGIVGRSGDKYTLFVGGHVLGHRLNFELRDLTPRTEIVPTLVPLLAAFKEQRQNGEPFGDFCQRLGQERMRTMIPAAATAHSVH